ncbi:hypothetical protein [Catellatospora vulcania]|uniref:hypothetical protein n=1 Tax=Catellatospora vulcania TaxID=1460450 RepID=UPI0012D4B0A6|nr:hypothetical protein [Catellatospora vulcania]
MRRVLTTAVLGLTLLGAAACTADPAETAAGPSSAAPAPAASSAAPAAPAAPTGTKGKDATCLAYTQLSLGTGLAVLAATTKIVGAALDDSAKAKPHLPELAKALNDYSSALAEIAADTADAGLKAALDTDLATFIAGQQAVAAAGEDVDKVIEVLDGEQFDIHESKTMAICAP